MEYRPMEVKAICAKELKNVNMFTKMDVYVMASILSDPYSVQRSPVHKKGGSDPVWNHRFMFNAHESEIKSNQIGLLVFRIISYRTLGDREIGRVYVPMKELYDNTMTGKENSGELSGEVTFMTCKVQTISGKFKGSLDFSYKFGEKIYLADRKVDEPVMAYPLCSYPVQGPVYPPSQEIGYGYSSRQQVPAPPAYEEAGYGCGYSGQVNPNRSNRVRMGSEPGCWAVLHRGRWWKILLIMLAVSWIVTSLIFDFLVLEIIL